MADVTELRVAMTVADFKGPLLSTAMCPGDTTRALESQGAPCPLEAGVPFSWLDEAQAENSRTAPTGNRNLRSVSAFWDPSPRGLKTA